MNSTVSQPSHTRLTLAQTSLWGGDPERAIAGCERVLRTAPDDLDAWLLKARAETQLPGEPRQAWFKAAASLAEAGRCATTSDGKVRVAQAWAEAAEASLARLDDVREDAAALHAQHELNAALCALGTMVAGATCVFTKSRGGRWTSFGAVLASSAASEHHSSQARRAAAGIAMADLFELLVCGMALITLDAAAWETDPGTTPSPEPFAHRLLAALGRVLAPESIFIKATSAASDLSELLPLSIAVAYAFDEARPVMERLIALHHDAGDAEGAARTAGELFLGGLRPAAGEDPLVFLQRPIEANIRFGARHVLGLTCKALPALFELCEISGNPALAATVATAALDAAMPSPGAAEPNATNPDPADLDRLTALCAGRVPRQTLVDAVGRRLARAADASGFDEAADLLARTGQILGSAIPADRLADAMRRRAGEIGAGVREPATVLAVFGFVFWTLLLVFGTGSSFRGALAGAAGLGTVIASRAAQRRRGELCASGPCGGTDTVGEVMISLLAPVTFPFTCAALLRDNAGWAAKAAILGIGRDRLRRLVSPALAALPESPGAPPEQLEARDEAAQAKHSELLERGHALGARLAALVDELGTMADMMFAPQRGEGALPVPVLLRGSLSMCLCRLVRGAGGVGPRNEEVLLTLFNEITQPRSLLNSATLAKHVEASLAGGDDSSLGELIDQALNVSATEIAHAIGDAGARGRVLGTLRDASALIRETATELTADGRRLFQEFDACIEARLTPATAQSNATMAEQDTAATRAEREAQGLCERTERFIREFRRPTEEIMANTPAENKSAGVTADLWMRNQFLEVMYRFVCLDNHLDPVVAPALAALFTELIAGIDEESRRVRATSRFMPTTYVNFIREQCELNRTLVSVPLQVPTLYRVTLMHDANHATSFAPALRALLLDIANFLARLDGQVSTREAAELARLDEVLTKPE